jgi:CheY-like chemotaxis protein
MNAILGMTGLSLETDVNDEQREYLTTVLSSAESLLTIINDLLDLARAEAGRFVVEEIPFSLRNTLDDVARTMRVRADEKGIGLEVRVAPDVPDWVAGDPGRLRQIVMNLVGNAVKFTDEGRVTVAAERDEDDLLRFDVTDTGIGIVAEHLDAIFGAFEQADGSMTRRHGGTGLGLAISSKLVEAMGGTIGVESTVGEGSTFSFTARLPATAALTAVGGVGMAGGPVMVVAEWPARERLVEMIEAAGYEAVGVGSSAEAQTAAANLRVEGRRVSALVVDFIDPELEYCRRLTASEMLAGAPLIAVVGTGRRGDGARFRAAGVRAYLTRPLGDTDLRDALGAIASGAAAEGILITRHWLRERRRPLQVLLADDSPTNRMLAVRILEKRGHRIVEVTDGIEATQAAAEQDFDVVLMDVQMPAMDGLDATRLIRAREAEVGADRVPIIALTAHAMETDRQRCLAAGMDGYLAKPFSPDDLAAIVEAAASMGATAMRSGGRGAGAFVASYPTLIDRLEDAAAAGRMAEAAALASTLAAGLGRIGAAEAASAAGRLAEAGTGDSVAFAGNFAKLAATLDQLEPQLGALAAE